MSAPATSSTSPTSSSPTAPPLSSVVRRPTVSASENFTAYLGLVGYVIPKSIGEVLLRRTFWGVRDVGLGADLMLSVVRNTTPLSLNAKRALLFPSNTTEIIESKRFSHWKDLVTPVEGKGWAGVWLCQNISSSSLDAIKASAPPTSNSPPSPKDSSIVLFTCHGGGYQLGTSIQNLTTHLRLAEQLAAAGHTVSIFSLAYSLAPEAVWPTQLHEAVAAYRCLVEQVGIPPSRIVVTGESAGGHLVLALLCQLHEERLEKPGGAVLLCPWVDLLQRGASIHTNQYRDSLVKESLDRAVVRLFPSPSMRTTHAAFLDFSEDKPSGYWKAVLPAQTAVEVGAWDCFLSSCEGFVERARADGVSVRLEVTQEKGHGWTGFADLRDVKKYTALGPGEEVGELMKGAGVFAELVEGVIRKA